MTKRYPVCLNPINILGGKRKERGGEEEREGRKERGEEEERKGRRGGKRGEERRRERGGERGEEREGRRGRRERKERRGVEKDRMKGGQKGCQVIETVAVKVFHKIICQRLLRKNLYTIQVIENLL